MTSLGPFVRAMAACATLVSCSSSTEGKAGGLLLLPQGPGFASSNAALDVPFMMAAAVFSLPGGSCGSGPCPPGSENVTVTAASCGAGECTVTLTPGAATFEVLPTRAGMVTVHAEARGDSGARYSGDAVGEMCRHRHALATVGDDPRRLGRGVDNDVAILDPLDLKAQASKEEMVSGRQG